MAKLDELFNKGEHSPMQLLADAGGEVIGRTRFQKIAFLLSEVGFLEGYDFEYHYYGPYSEKLSSSLKFASLFGQVNEMEKDTEWGGQYSVYSLPDTEKDALEAKVDRAIFIKPMLSCGSIVLELAATAAFLANDSDVSDPWQKTCELKPRKATPERLKLAKALYNKLVAIATPKSLPRIV